LLFGGEIWVFNVVELEGSAWQLGFGWNTRFCAVGEYWAATWGKTLANMEVPSNVLRRSNQGVEVDENAKFFGEDFNSPLEETRKAPDRKNITSRCLPAATMVSWVLLWYLWRWELGIGAKCGGMSVGTSLPLAHMQDHGSKTYSAIGINVEKLVSWCTYTIVCGMILWISVALLAPTSK